MNTADLLNAPTPILVALACNAVGFIIAKTPWVANKWIPVLLMLAGCLLYLGCEGFTWRHLTEGIVCGAGAVGFNQAVRQLIPEGKPQ